MSFLLDKWYFDLVSPLGVCWIGYCARLELRPLRIAYAAELVGEHGSAPCQRRVLSGAGWPEERAGSVLWRCDGLGIEGGWERIDPCFERRLIESEQGGVAWRCEMPRARAMVRRGGGVLEGTGYCERLRMTLPPWRLPIASLHWGRWHRDDEDSTPRGAGGPAAPGSIVWIRWEGPRPLTLVLCDGVEAGESAVDADEVCTQGGRLSLERQYTLRDGALGGTVLGGIPGIGKLAPSMLATTETKWLSRGIMNAEGSGPVEGWAVHEVVRFGGG